MRKMILAATVAMSSVALPCVAANADYENDHRSFYAFFQYNYQWNAYGFGQATFADTNDSKLIYDYNKLTMVGLYAGAGVDGLIYGYEYLFTSSMEEPTPTDFISYNIYTGERSVIAPWSVKEGSSFRPIDMTYDNYHHQMYAVGYDYGHGLYRIDIETGAYELVAPLSDGIAIAADKEGTLYVLTMAGDIATVNPSNGNLTVIGSTGLDGFADRQSLEFDLTTGILYWGASYNGSADIQLLGIDFSDPANQNPGEGKTFKFNVVGQVGSQARMNALYIPYADSMEAPAAPSAIKGTPDAENPLSVTIGWTNPTTSFVGADLESLSGVVIKRNGEQLAFFRNPEPGARMDFTDDTATADGLYRYDIIAYNAGGNGPAGVCYQYLGVDRPGMATDITVTPASDLCSTVVTWKTPETGFHGGYVDPADIRYTVKRLPDNLVIAENLTECKVEDNNFRRMLNYAYQITAVNSKGETDAVSKYRVLGPAQEVPYEITLEDTDMFYNQWTLVDGNNDSYSWLANTGMGHALFGDYEPALEYILSPTSTGGDLQDADEWIISPTLKLTPGTNYMVTFGIRTLYEEDFEVYYGTTNATEGMEKVGEFTAKLDWDQDNGRAIFTPYKTVITAKDNIGCIALRLVTPLMYSQGFASLQVNAISVYDATGVADITAGDAREVKVLRNGDMLHIDGEFASAALYNASGMLCGRYTAADIDLSGLASGVYVLNIAGPAPKTVKLMVK